MRRGLLYHLAIAVYLAADSPIMADHAEDNFDGDISSTEEGGPLYMSLMPASMNPSKRFPNVSEFGAGGDSRWNQKNWEECVLWM